MTDPAFRAVGSFRETVAASSRIGFRVVREEGALALMKGSVLFSGKRVADWTTRYLFATLWEEAYRGATGKSDAFKLSFWERSFCALAGPSFPFQQP